MLLQRPKKLNKKKNMQKKKCLKFVQTIKAQKNKNITFVIGKRANQVGSD